MNLALINNAKPLSQRTLLLRINNLLAIKATWTRIGPTVGGLPTPVTFRTLKFSVISFISLVRSKPLLSWTSQNIVLNVLTLLKIEMAQISTRRFHQEPAGKLGRDKGDSENIRLRNRTRSRGRVGGYRCGCSQVKITTRLIVPEERCFLQREISIPTNWSPR